MSDWRSRELAHTYLEGVRGAIPLADTQIKIIRQLARSWRPDFKSFLDLGCGDGILGQSLFGISPRANGVFLDFSEPMIERARNKANGRHCTFVIQDYSSSDWMDAISEFVPLDLVISGFSIHHLEDATKARVYADIYQILKPGGLFLNLEHVSSPSEPVEQEFNRLFVDHLLNYHRQTKPETTREEIEDQYFNRDDKILNKLSPVDTQCQWLRDIGFKDVDCFFKIFELALFGGVKPD